MLKLSANYRTLTLELPQLLLGSESTFQVSDFIDVKSCITIQKLHVEGRADSRQRGGGGDEILEHPLDNMGVFELLIHMVVSDHLSFLAGLHLPPLPTDLVPVLCVSARMREAPPPSILPGTVRAPGGRGASLQLSPCIHPSSADGALREISASFRAPTRSVAKALTGGRMDVLLLCQVRLI